ncbi:hypothetical protein SASPL_151311 [Salvia splendens]|uniref:Uncharacterized protein n=1 Tax=Salvia splendens TaxID=180675 RepID=A0A8X8Z3L2_SALSN|nr:hypothetical protein SASPL_151311 [Salvia splendens]
MIKGAVSVVDQTSFMYHARFPYLAAVNLYGNSSFLPCKSGTKAPDYGDHILLLQGRGKLTPIAAYSMPPEREDASPTVLS